MGRRAWALLIGVGAVTLAAALILASTPRAPNGVVLEPIWRTSDILARSYSEDVTTDRILDGATGELAMATDWQVDELAEQAALDGSAVPAGVPDGYEPLWHVWQVAAAGVPARDAPGLVDAAVRGMVGATGDPRALVVTGDYSAQDEYYDDNRSGIGAIVQIRNGDVVIDQPFPGGPAARAGTLPGDVVLAVDGRPVTADDLAQVADWLRGDPGTQVVVLVSRDRIGEVEVTITRDELPLTSAGVQHLAGDIGYLHVTRFADDTADLVAERIRALVGQGARGLIVDLRGTAGGRPSAAADVADHFLDGGVAYVTEDLDGVLDHVLVGSGGLAVGMPMAVLVDERTAGPAEMYAATIQDHRRAAILGTPTAGDTALHRPFQVGEDLAIVVLAGRWHAPSGPDRIDGGLQPDAVVPLLDEDVATGYDRQMFAAYTYLWVGLGGAIEGG